MAIILPPSHLNYRLGDLILQKDRRAAPCDDGWGTKESDSAQTLAECTIQNWPRSVASTYLQQTDNIGDVKLLTNIMVDVQARLKFDIPMEDDIVLHVRVGDVIDFRSKCPPGYTNDVPTAADFWARRTNSFPWLGSPSWAYYVRCKDEIEDLLRLLRRISPHNKLKLVYGVHTSGSFPESIRYLNMLRDHCTSWGYETEFVTHSDADESFIYMCHARTFCAAAGVFSHLVCNIVRELGHVAIQQKTLSRRFPSSIAIAAALGATIALLLFYRYNARRRLKVYRFRLDR